MSLVSISVDPEFDTPDRLREYGRLHGVDAGRWTLLTGEREAVERVVFGGFRTPMGELEKQQPGLVEIAHTGK